MNNLYLLAEQATNTNSQNSVGALISTALPLVLLIALMYFMLIRPQRKKQKEEEKMRNEMQVGDEIITVGGIYGRVVSIKDDSLVIESSGERSKIQITKTAVATNLTVHDATPESK
ncbi:MAG: preprotein translocase subunit YajC [Firmicutes bacterium]|nr:preprotein translocase subunit YajC [Bacillota bacterium]